MILKNSSVKYLAFRTLSVNVIVGQYFCLSNFLFLVEKMGELQFLLVQVAMRSASLLSLLKKLLKMTTPPNSYV